MTYKEQYKDCLNYIDKYWNRVTHHPEKRKINHRVIKIPYTYITPNDRKFNYMFYWDTFFMFRGLIGTKREWILKQMANNMTYLFDTYGIIPNFNAPASMGRSQPPFLSSMILDTYNGYYFNRLRLKPHRRIFSSLRPHKKWLRKAGEIAKKEYEHVWIDAENHFHHSVDGYGLARYGDRDIGYAHSSELESGWDFTSRFFNRCDEFFPIDLNVFLYKYERDFAKIAFHLGDHKEEAKWKEIASKRKAEINAVLWDEKKGFFYDYCYTFKRVSDFLSLASFTPLWAGFATPEQAAHMVKKLHIFEGENGLFITAKQSIAPKVDLSGIPVRYLPAIEDVLVPKQWDYPHIWPPLEYLTVVGLLKYGYADDAKRIMEKSLAAWSRVFKKYGTFFEKMNGETGARGDNFEYEDQEGFGWTNAIFYRYVHLLDDINSGRDIYKQPKPVDPPYGLAALH